MNQVSLAQILSVLFDLTKHIDFAAISTAVASTFAGAFIAFKFQELAVRRRKNLEESIALNRATAIVTSHLNAVGNYKRQIASLKQIELRELTELHDAIEVKRQNGEPLPKLAIQPKHLLHKSQPISYVKGQITTCVSVLSSIAGRPLAMAAEMERSTETLNSLIESQNQLVDEQWRDRNDRYAIYRMLGLVMEDGSVDSRFSHLVEQIHTTSLDIVFFGDAIVKDLVDHHLKWREINGGPPKSIMRYSATDALNNEIKSIHDKEDWRKYPIVRRYKI